MTGTRHILTTLLTAACLAAGAAGIFAALKTPLLPALKREGA